MRFLVGCAGDHTGAGGGTGRWAAETWQLPIHAGDTQGPREAAQCGQRRDAQVTPSNKLPICQQYQRTFKAASPSAL